MNRPETTLQSLAKQSARNAIKLVDARLGEAEPMTGWQRMVDTLQQRLLLPFWREEVYAYSGITIFFDAAPQTDTLGGKFRTFFKAYVENLITEMQQTRRAYRINIVVPGDRTNDDGGVYKLQDLMGYVHAAEPRQTSKGVDVKEKGAYKGTTDLTVEYLVLMSDPMTDTKKVLRAKIDQSDPVKGADRVAFLASVVPILQLPPIEKPPWGKQQSIVQFDDDLAYMKWNYGGVAMWEPPGTGGGDKADNSKLDHYFHADKRYFSNLCDFVCVNRMPLRLLLQTLVLLGALSIALFALNCDARQWIGKHWVALCLGGGGATAVLALAMLDCDPSLQSLSQSNMPLIAVTVVFFLYLLYAALKPRDEPR